MVRTLFMPSFYDGSISLKNKGYEENNTKNFWKLLLITSNFS